MATGTRTRQGTLPLTSPEKFSAAMDKAGLTCEELAAIVGCSKAMIGHLRTGHHTATSTRLALALEHVLTPKAKRLFGDGSEVSPPRRSTLSAFLREQ